MLLAGGFDPEQRAYDPLADRVEARGDYASGL